MDWPDTGIARFNGVPGPLHVTDAPSPVVQTADVGVAVAVAVTHPPALHAVADVVTACQLAGSTQSHSGRLTIPNLAGASPMAGSGRLICDSALAATVAGSGGGGGGGGADDELTQVSDQAPPMVGVELIVGAHTCHSHWPEPAPGGGGAPLSAGAYAHETGLGDGVDEPPTEPTSTIPEPVPPGPWSPGDPGTWATQPMDVPFAPQEP